MKAVLLHEYGGPENLRYEEDVPEPALSADSVLVEAAATSVNPVDWKIRSGARQKDFPLQLPAILGRDVSGIVRAVGDNIRTFKPGERVLAYATHTYAELVAVAGSTLTHLPAGLDLVDSAAIPLIALTGEQLVRLAARAQPGQTVLVSGALGSVGRAAVHAARKLGATVIAGVRARQLPQAGTLGVSGTVAIDDDSAIAGLAKVDCVADTVGGETAAKLFATVKDGGNFGYASVLPDGVQQRNLTVTITRVFAHPDASKVREFADDIRDGKFVLPISQRLPLREAGKAHALAQQGGAGKIVLVCQAHGAPGVAIS
ncbi:MAG TPA: NADP-dependent oxidoreductase [Steroidobacteraceae bacterium]|jgi:NADPH:quinone reductase-like Zn-dependent oxidoreductase|nr:NADP-dependent oxidoreductase [Steroidobacteraceae bacterium]